MTERLFKSKRVAYLAWAIIGVAIILWGCINAIELVLTPVAIVLFSAFLVFLLRVPVAWLERHNVPRALGAAISYCIAIASLAIILLLILPVLAEQFASLAEQMPGYVNAAGEFFRSLYERYHNLIEDSTVQQFILSIGGEISKFATSLASGSASGIIGLTGSIANALFVVLVSVIVGFWVLMDLPHISREVMILVGPRFQTDVRFIASALSRSLGGYLKSMVVAAICTGIMASVCYYFIGLPYPAVLGMLTGLMNFVPFIGPWIAAAFAALLGIFVSPLTAILAIAGTVVPQFLTDNFITPRVMSGNVALHPSVVIIALLAGAAIGGFFGVLCAVPLTAAMKTIFVYYFEKRTGRRIVSRNGALFKGKSAKEDDPAFDGTNAKLLAVEMGEHERRALESVFVPRRKPRKRKKLDDDKLALEQASIDDEAPIANDAFVGDDIPIANDAFVGDEAPKTDQQKIVPETLKADYATIGHATIEQPKADYATIGHATIEQPKIDHATIEQSTIEHPTIEQSITEHVKIEEDNNEQGDTSDEER
ncbi:MAG: AI-2E family transporter [Coriobacteriales bacterium]|jgi:predicted PurR-regulated permease PerM|nr:AI-2E family transporter [Coriobacteriales bacterium]